MTDCADRLKHRIASRGQHSPGGLAGGGFAGSHHTGFTLMEILAVMAIVAILAALVMPSYEDSVRKSRRADGRSALSEMAGRQEQFFAQNNSYTMTVDVAGTGLGMGGTQSIKGYYELSVEACSGGSVSRCYLLTATATGTQEKDETCNKLTLDNAGRRAAYDKSGGDSTETCW
jgi:type IV pilus assembly protein PilE